MAKYEYYVVYKVFQADADTATEVEFRNEGKAQAYVNALNKAYEQGVADATVNKGAYEPSQLAIQASPVIEAVAPAWHKELF